MDFGSFAGMMLIGLGLDLVLGWPSWLFQRIGHPVTWIGALIDMLEARMNTRSIWRGAGLVAIVVGLTIGIAVVLQTSLPEGPIGLIMGGILAWPLIAVRSLHQHVADVARPLASGDLEGARDAVSMIVGRDPEKLDAPAIARATLESLAENTSDGVVAPLFWGVVAGLPGIAAYKAINTLDSMIGHRNARFERFGKVAARLDDLVNLIPSRMTALMFFTVSRHRSGNDIVRESRTHRSPNAGWPEGALASILGVRLSGPRVYGDRISEEPWINGTAPDPTPQDLWRALAFYRRLVLLLPIPMLAIWGSF